MPQKTTHASHHSRRPFYRRKGFLWSVGIVFSLIFIVLLTFRLSPWPGALIIRSVFEKNDAKVTKALEKYTPIEEIAIIQDQTYRPNDKDAHLDVYLPKSVLSSATTLPLIIWTHGGAWVSGGRTDNATYYKLLAAKGFAVVALDYTLGPEATYPTALHQLNDAYGYLQTNSSRLHVDTNRTILAGDSAGSQLSSQMATIITNPSYAKLVGVTPKLQPSQLKGVILNCGIYKMDGLVHPDPTIPKIIGWGTDVSVWAYTGTRDFSSPVIKQMSAYYHITKDFPPTYITGGNSDPLTDAQSKPFADKLESLGVNVQRLFYPANHRPGLPHEYQFNLDNSDGKNALKATVDFAKGITQ